MKNKEGAKNIYTVGKKEHKEINIYLFLCKKNKPAINPTYKRASGSETERVRKGKERGTRDEGRVLLPLILPSCECLCDKAMPMITYSLK